MATVDPGNTLGSLDPSQDSSSVNVFVTAPADSYHSNGEVINLGPVTGTETTTGLNLVYVADSEAAQFQTIATGDSSDNVTITFDPTTGTLNAQLLDANGNILDDSGANTTGSITLPLAGLAAGQYQVVVTSMQDLTAPSYTLSITAPNPSGIDLAAASISVPSPVASGSTTVAATIANLGNTAAGAFQIEYVLTPDGNSESPNAIPLGSPITIAGLAAGATATDDETFDLSGIASGQYDIAVIVDPQHQITVTSTDDETALTPLAVLPSADAYEPNNTLATATPLTFTAGQATVSNLTLTSPADVNYFSLNLANISTYTDSATITYNSNEPDLEIDLLDSQGDLLVSGPGSDGTAAVSLADLLPGDYYLEVSPPAGFGFSSGYSLDVSVAPPGANNGTITSSLVTQVVVAPQVTTVPAVTVPTASVTTLATSVSVAAPQPAVASPAPSTVSVASSPAQPAASPQAAGPISPADSTGGVPNGDFSDSNPSDPNFDWTVSGDINVASGAATLQSGGNSVVTELSQVLTVPADAESLTFTINNLDLQQGQELPPDAFEVAVSDPTTLASLLATDGVSQSDAVLNMQSGEATFGSEVTIPGLAQSGGTLPSSFPLTITVGLNSISAGQQIELAFDLIHFADSSVSLSNVQFNIAALPTLTPVVSVNNGAWGYDQLGKWQVHSGGWEGSYRTHAAGTNGDYAQWLMEAPPGTYEIFADWIANSGNATDATYQVEDGNTVVGTVTVDQTQTPQDAQYGGIDWASLGTYTFTTPLISVTLTDQANGTVVADGIIVNPATPLQITGTQPDNTMSLPTGTTLDGVVFDPGAAATVLTGNSINLAGNVTDDSREYADHPCLPGACRR